MLGETVRSRWFSVSVHAALWLLLLLIVLRLGGTHPRFNESRPNPATVVAPAPVARLEHLFVARPATPAASLNLQNPFDTTYFIPHATPPPAPTTRKIQLTYRGFYQTANQPKHALVLYDNTHISVAVGSSVVTNLFVAQVTATSLTLTNALAQTNVLTLNTRKEIEIPLR